MHVPLQVSSREFGFHAANGTHTDYLVPVADMCNNDGERYNVQQSNDGTKFYITAVQPIAAGQELLLPYLPGLDHRNDITLAGYGFVLKRDVPILPATDLPTFDPEAPYAPTPATDAEYYGPLGSFNTEEELRRLGGLLEAAGTSEDDDVRLLESENVTDWREGVVLEYRVQRKKAIRLAMAAIRKELVSKMASDDEE